MTNSPINEEVVKQDDEFSKQDNEVVKPTQQDLFDRFVNLYHEQATVGLDIKALSDEFKEFYPDEDLTTIKQVAKLKSEEKLGKKVSDFEKFKEVAETFC